VIGDVTMISPLRWLKLGLASEDVCAMYGITPEELDYLAEEAECRRRENSPSPAGRMLMTPLLVRPDMDRWESRRAER
jgi:hypothetical protein